MTEQPATSLAKRLVEKYRLVPPVDVDSLVRRYAHLDFAEFPFEGIDGVCVDLKARGKKPRVIVNAHNSPTRQRFTLAHELGHVVIPWHMGTIIDRTDTDSFGLRGDYWETESEANAFAAELLMPSGWIASLLRGGQNLAQAHASIFKQCNTSPVAAAIQLARQLPSNIVFAGQRAAMVEFSGRTAGTLAGELARGTTFNRHAYGYCEEHSCATVGDRQFHWWKLPTEIHLVSDDARSWREILDQIVTDIGVHWEEVQKFKMSLNGVVANANSAVKRSNSYTVGAVSAACVQRLGDRGQFAAFVSHPKFNAFVLRRAEDLVLRRANLAQDRRTD